MSPPEGERLMSHEVIKDLQLITETKQSWAWVLVGTPGKGVIV